MNRRPDVDRVRAVASGRTVPSGRSVEPPSEPARATRPRDATVWIQDNLALALGAGAAVGVVLVLVFASIVL